MGRDSIQDILSDPSRFLGAAPTQVDSFLARVETLRARFPEAAAYRPEPIL
ncbi:MAG: hypothetical protein IIA41_06370 [SAR324 cluster bacterium]|nr:hypothetical protein [SAR324 cluster bacterium]